MGDLGKIFVAPALKSCPKCKKSPNLVTLDMGLIWVCNKSLHDRGPKED